jgi:hypothetical protein
VFVEKGRRTGCGCEQRWGSLFSLPHKLKLCLEQARAQVQGFKGEMNTDPDPGKLRRRAAHQRAAEERQRRLEQALEELAQVEKQKKKSR